tara:strand:+ start:117 stop:1580 length:1464 start_codon:yes stop_codon:yes gene_type:complete
MADIIDLEIRYKGELEQAKAFLSSNLKKAGRTPANPEQKQHFLDKGADCPQCGDPFHEGNHNTEHIFPIAIGGKNTTANRIQLCRMCNNSRNKVMQSSFADNPRSIYPEKWPQIKRILLWHLVTIDDGVEAGKIFPVTHKLFMRYSTGGKPFPNHPKRAYGPFSTWKARDEPNYPHNHSSGIKRQRVTTGSFSFGLVVRNALDKFFGYEPKVEAQSSVKVTENTESPILPENGLKPLPENKPLKEIPEGVDGMGFTEAITNIISGDKEITVMSIGNRIRKMQENDGWGEVGTRSFLQHYGFSRNFGLLNALKGTFEDRIIVKGTKSEQRIQIIGTQVKHKQSEPEPEPEPGDNPLPFPLITNFNTSASGLRLPRHPKQLIECIVAYENKRLEIHTGVDITRLFKQILGGRNHTDSTVSKFTFLLFPDDPKAHKDKDWTEANPIGDLLTFTESFKSNIINIIERNELEPEFINHANKYFEMAKAHLQT